MISSLHDDDYRYINVLFSFLYSCHFWLALEQLVEKASAVRGESDVNKLMLRFSRESSSSGRERCAQRHVAVQACVDDSGMMRFLQSPASAAFTPGALSQSSLPLTPSSETSSVTRMSLFDDKTPASNVASFNGTPVPGLQALSPPPPPPPLPGMLCICLYCCYLSRVPCHYQFIIFSVYQWHLLHLKCNYRCVY